MHPKSCKPAAHGVEAVLTRADHVSGSDRLAEACELLGLDGQDLVVNVQGDEPLIAPAMIDACADLLRQRSECVMSTVAHALDDSPEGRAEFANPNVVKVVTDKNGLALYFSRAHIPFWRDGQAQNPGQPQPGTALRHVGLYAYLPASCAASRGWQVSPLEQIESLEQLRVLWHGERIAVHVSERAAGPGRRHPRGPGARAQRDSAHGPSASAEGDPNPGVTLRQEAGPRVSLA